MEKTMLDPERFAEFILNNKKADALELNPSLEGLDASFIPIYRDKSVEIFYNCIESDDGSCIEDIYIFSSWWGRIKNSFFTIEGEKGKFPKKKMWRDKFKGS